MKYRVIKALDLDQLIQRVNDALRYGWKLHAGVAMSSDREGLQVYAQAMVRASKGKSGEQK